MENDTTMQEVPGTDWKPVNEKTIEDALQMFQKYKEAKDDLTKRITNAEEWWKITIGSGLQAHLAIPMTRDLQVHGCLTV